MFILLTVILEASVVHNVFHKRLAHTSDSPTKTLEYDYYYYYTTTTLHNDPIQLQLIPGASRTYGHCAVYYHMYHSAAVGL